MHEALSTEDLAQYARAAAKGDRNAAKALLDAVQDGVYTLSLRMLGHPADAEDATQEILVIVLTNIGSFRGESAFRTWVWRIAVNHLSRVKLGRREVMTFETLEDRLRTGLSASEAPDPEAEALTGELRLRCTQAMLLSLDRTLRLAYVLGDVLNLSGEQAAEVLGVEPAAYRKRLSRARTRLYDFLRGWCGLLDAASPCRCAGQVKCAVERGVLDPRDLDLSRQVTRRQSPALRQAAAELGELLRVAEVVHGSTETEAPGAMVERLRELLGSDRLELLRH